MKRYTIWGLCLLIFIISFNVNGAVDKNWDWQKTTAYKDFYGRTILGPWPTEHFGLDVSKDFHNKSDGWMLYTKRMVCTDYADFQNTDVCVKNGVLPRYKYPFFVLYNQYTGQLRTFIFINDENYTGEKILYAKMGVAGTDHGLFLNNGRVSTPITEKTKDSNTDVVSIVPAYKNKWLVLDHDLSYDSSLIGDDLRFEIKFDAFSEQEVSLSGKLNLTLNSIRQSGGSFDLQSVLGYVNLVDDRMGSIDDAANTLEQRGQRLIEQGNMSLGTPFLNAATFLSGTGGGWVGAAWAGYSIFDSFTNMGGNSVSTQYFTGDISLNGTIVNQFPKEFIKFGVHKSRHTISGDEPILSLQNNLGLFSLKRRPKIEIGYDYVELIDNISDLIDINPETGMQLVEVKVKLPSVEFSLYDNQNLINLSSRNDEGNFSGKVLPNLTNPGYPVIKITQNGYISDGKARYYFDFREFSNPSTVYPKSHIFSLNGIRMTGNDPLFYMRGFVEIYLRFEHKNNPGIFAEFERNYDYQLVNKPCGKYFSSITANVDPAKTIWFVDQTPPCANPNLTLKGHGTENNVYVTNQYGVPLELWGDINYANVQATANQYCNYITGKFDGAASYQTNACGEDESIYYRFNPAVNKWQLRESPSANRCYKLISRVNCIR